MKKPFYILSIVALFLASCSDDNKGAIDTIVKPIAEGTVTPNVGGPNQQNQVYIDLSTNTQKVVQKDTWDLGFYTGNDFRVILNGSIKMAVKKTTSTNIADVQTPDAAVAVGYTTSAKFGYVDNPTGILQGSGNGEGTAIAEIAENDSENFVYLVNLGYTISTSVPKVGSVSTDGEARGWKKIKITRKGSDYILQYADLNATTAQSLTITKNTNYNFIFVNLISGKTVEVQPEKNKWDLNFTGFVNYIGGGSASLAYFFSDFVTTNILGGTKVYEVVIKDATKTQTAFENFVANDVDDAKFNISTSDQRVIGSNWRNGGGPGFLPSIKDDRFYILKDVDGNLYKLHFVALTNESGVRGYPVFKYEILQ